MNPTRSRFCSSADKTNFAVRTQRFMARAGVVAVGVLLSAAALAQGYAGNGMAVPGGKGDQPKFRLAAGEAVPSVAVADKRAGEWKAYGSYQFTETWGAEFNYSNWGRAAGLAGAKPAVPASTPSGLAARGSQVDVSATGTLPLTRSLSLFGKLGYGRNEINASPYCLSAACGPLGGARSEGARAGVGLRYSFSDSWGLRVDYENVNTLATPNAVPAKGDSWSARIKYTF